SSIRSRALLRITQVTLTLSLLIPFAAPLLPNWINVSPPRFSKVTELGDQDLQPGARFTVANPRVKGSLKWIHVTQNKTGNILDKYFNEKVFWLFVLFTGTFLSLGFSVRGIWQLQKFLSRCTQLKRIGKIHLMISDENVIPFATRSLFKFYIVVPSSLLES